MASSKNNSKSGSSAGRRTRIVISIIYIIAGAATIIPALGSLSTLSLATLIGLAGSALMLVTGVIGLFNVKKAACRTLGIILFCIFAFSLALDIINGGDLDPLRVIEALISWLFVTVV